MFVVTGCASGRATEDYCLIESPYRPSFATVTVMTDAEVAWGLEHNKYGAERCGWKP